MDESLWREQLQAEVLAHTDTARERDRLRALSFLLYRTLHDGPVDDIPWLLPWARDLLKDVVSEMRTTVAAGGLLDVSGDTGGKRPPPLSPEERERRQTSPRPGEYVEWIDTPGADDA